ncbi:hypothetical protein B0T26DRAFT_19797 [Lasiosphaeria miniovina]|uniref:Transfer RNA methyltransferase 82 n=1 Tax=Lasiosphaeria miniovina TaxID=1954250 RepID=A0AA40BFU9_9PEZI|nr:uncharacterized protein B0T26DRAFT_19797 [Lasiosphaeria miniovina]KAK0733436.1 hypothetical protein B0T26DRAFT_19797 [Lasiosphaeria miniovina]
MALPYHMLKVCGDILFAARGSSIHSFNLNLEPLGTWKYPVQQASGPSAPSHSQQPREPPAPQSKPPSKRRKLEAGQEPVINSQDADADADQETPQPGNRRRRRNKSGSHEPSYSSPHDVPFIHELSATTDGRHIVAITGSDKTIWVFEHDGAGNLKELSRRMMPKRPCSIAITPNNQTILSADKFGDVYALPLIPTPADEKKEQHLLPQQPQDESKDTTAATAQAQAQAQALFKPQANEFTVHTKRNLMALENQKLALQLKTAEEKHAAAAAANGAEFEHTLLLGHVSMLTAVVVATAGPREFIITADRDEHIRLSRGRLDQAHIIEGFCLGHDDFVSRLCVPPGRPELLISGGGGDHLFVWDWADGTLLSKANILEHAHDAAVVPTTTTTPGESDETETKKIAVSRLYACQLVEEDGAVANWVFVVSERVPAVFCYSLHAGASTLQHHQTIATPGGAFPLDVAVLYGAADAPLAFARLLVTLDPNSGLRAASSPANPPLAAVLGWAPGSGWSNVLQTPPGLITAAAAAGGDAAAGVSAEDLHKILYSTDSLRKTSMDFE